MSILHRNEAGAHQASARVDSRHARQHPRYATSARDLKELIRRLLASTDTLDNRPGMRP